ncbi:T-cell surface glycoprotein CD3 gamma chain-like [Pelodytes ibericus]
MACLSHSHWALMIILSITGSLAEVVEKNGKLSLSCSQATYKWKKDNVYVNDNDNKILEVGSTWDDPRGVYSCSGAQSYYIDVYVRMCQNCIELDYGTIAGFLIADIIMIGLIGMAVYFVSGTETRRPPRASDKQVLIQNESQYQVLQGRQEDVYKHLRRK